MSTQLPDIRSVKNNIVEVALPYIEGAPTTYLTAEVAAGGTSQTFADNSGLANADYLILGEGETSEIVKINGAVTYGTAVTTTACVFPHGYGTKVTLIRYNQVAIYGSSSASDAAPTIIGSAVDLDVAHGFNVLVASTTYDYYYARYYNVGTTTYSQYSTSVASSGLSARARGELKKEFLSIYNEQIDDLITDDWLNRAINRWQRKLSERRKYWNVLKTSQTTDLVEDQQAYSMPTDIQDFSKDSIITVKIYNQPAIDPIDRKVFQDLTYDNIGTTVGTAIGLADPTVVLSDASDFPSSGSIHVEGDTIDYTGKSTNTLTGVTGITATHAAGKEVWSTYNKGQPSNYLIDPETMKIKLNPVPDSTNAGKNMVIEYWQKFEDLATDASETLFTQSDNLFLFLNHELAIRRRLPADEILARKAEWRDDLENLVVQDPDYKQIRIQPRNLYARKY
jgi:hypothetical protein